MACRLTGAEPLSEPMLEYRSLDPGEQISIKFSSKYSNYLHENAFENVVTEMAAILSQCQYVNKSGLTGICAWTSS